MKNTSLKFIYLVLILGTFAACSKGGNNDPAPDPNNPAPPPGGTTGGLNACEQLLMPQGINNTVWMQTRFKGCDDAGLGNSTETEFLIFFRDNKQTLGNTTYSTYMLPSPGSFAVVMEGANCKYLRYSTIFLGNGDLITNLTSTNLRFRSSCFEGTGTEKEYERVATNVSSGTMSLRHEGTTYNFDRVYAFRSNKADDSSKVIIIANRSTSSFPSFILTIDGQTTGTYIIGPDYLYPGNSTFYESFFNSMQPYVNRDNPELGAGSVSLSAINYAAGGTISGTFNLNVGFSTPESITNGSFTATFIN